jgi:Lon protease-like protein
MPGWHPRLADLPAEFPIFPLAGALLLPHGRLPLNIFEPRYLAMTEDAVANGRMFAMIQPDRAHPAGSTGPAIYRIGCLGRLTAFSETDDGRFLITLTGVIRFAVAEELEMRRGYRRVRADLSGFAADLAPPEPQPGLDRAALLAALREYFARRAFEANWDAISAMPDDALVTTLGMVCPFDPVEKQALLESASPADRSATLLALLQIDSHQDEAAPRHRRAS